MFYHLVFMPRRSRRRVRVARSRRFTSAKRSKGSNAVFNIGGIKIFKSDIMQTLGAASAGTVGGLANQLSGGRVVGNTAQAVGGLALGFIGGRNAKNIGKGVLMKTGGDFIEDNVLPQVAGGLGLGTSSGNGSTQQATDGWE